MAIQEDIREEQIRMIKVRVLADLTAYRLQHMDERDQALALIGQTREQILALCPGKDAVFDLVLRPRFMRIMDERVLAKWGAAESWN